MTDAKRRRIIDHSLVNEDGVVPGARKLSPNELAFNEAATRGLDTGKKSEIIESPEFAALYTETVVPLVNGALEVLTPVFAGELGPGLYPTKEEIEKRLYQMIGDMYFNDGGVPDTRSVIELLHRVNRVKEVNAVRLEMEQDIEASFSGGEYGNIQAIREAFNQAPDVYLEFLRSKMETYSKAARLFDREKKEQTGIGPDSGIIARAWGWLRRSKEAREEFEALERVRSPIVKEDSRGEFGYGHGAVATKADIIQLKNADIARHVAVLAPERRALLSTFLEGAGLHILIREKIESTMREKTEARSSDPDWKKRGKAAEVALSGLRFTHKVAEDSSQPDPVARFYRETLGRYDASIEADVRADFDKRLSEYAVKKGYIADERSSDVGASRMPYGLKPEREIPAFLAAFEDLEQLGGRDKVAILTMLERLCRERADEIQNGTRTLKEGLNVDSRNKEVQVTALLNLAKSYQESIRELEKKSSQDKKKP